MAVIVAVCSLLVFMLAALVVDLGQAHNVRREAQNASDASVLAAGNALYLSGTTTPDVAAAAAAAKSYGSNNYGITDAQWTSCTDPGALPYQPAGTQCISFDQAAKPGRVRVVVPARQVATPFASLIGVESVS